jgi:hypothetical protein
MPVGPDRVGIAAAPDAMPRREGLPREPLLLPPEAPETPRKGPRDGQRVRYGGIVICRQRPGTASGVTFMPLEDETGSVNVVLWRKVFDRPRAGQGRPGCAGARAGCAPARAADPSAVRGGTSSAFGTRGPAGRLVRP